MPDDPAATRGEVWFDQALRAYAVFCMACPNDALRMRLAAAIDAALIAWESETELSAEHLASIEEWLMRGGPDFEVARVLVELYQQIEAGGPPRGTLSPGTPGTPPNRLQRRILERWADEMRQFNPTDSLARGIDILLSAPTSGQPLTVNDRDVLEAYAIGEGPRGRALRCALEAVNDDREASPEQPPTNEIRVSDLSALSETDRSIIAKLDAALHGVKPATGSEEETAIATMNRFVEILRRSEAASKYSANTADDIPKHPLEYYMAQFEQTLRGEPDKYGIRIVNTGEFDRSLVELMQYFHAQLPPSAAHVAIAALVRGLLEGHGLIAHDEPS